MFAFSVALIALVAEGNSSRAAAQAQPKIEATIFSYDGKDFVRTQTTLVSEDGKSAVNTKLDHATPAYKGRRRLPKTAICRPYSALEISGASRT